MFVNWLKALAVSLFLALTATPVAAATTDPAVSQIQGFYSSLVSTMKRGPDLGLRGRYQALAPAIDAAFDIPTMIRFIVGPTWSSLSDSDQKALIEGFRRLTIANYASNFDSFHGERFDVDPTVLTHGEDHIVQSTLTSGAGKQVPLLYRMRDTTGSWKIIDVLLNGYVSELATRRSDFSATLASGGAPALVKQLNLLADNLLAGNKPKSG